MYQAIYRKYRPKTFDDVIGQGDVVELLKNQVSQGKIGHAYIFTGTRGTGKTSCAKIMAKAVNCLSPKEGNPCNECENCKAIKDQSTMDVVEMDAASNRRIDDIRELRDQVIFPPASLKYKVYIIDEAHMITNEGFNALLKIMEEPPDHLIFILATTEINKIPQTILSRCQRYDFKRISPSGIRESVKLITEDLGIDIEDGAIDLIVRAADGALRDAQSLLDQVLASSDGRVTEKLVASVIGSVGSTDLFDLVKEIGEKNEGQAIKLASEILGQSGATELVASLIDHYQNLIIAKSVPEMMEIDKEKISLYIDQAKLFKLEDLADSIDILLDNEYKLKISSQTRSIALTSVINLIRQTNRKNLLSRIEALEKNLAQIQTQGQGEVKKPRSVESSDYGRNYNIAQELESPADAYEEDQQDQERPLEKEESLKDSGPSSPSPKKDPKGLDIYEEWPLIKDELVRSRPMWGMWINDLEPGKIEEDILYLEIDASEKTKIHRAKDNLEDLGKDINSYLKASYKVLIKEKFEEKKEDPAKKDTKEILKDMFGDKLNIK